MILAVGTISKDVLLWGGIALGAIILALIGYVTDKKAKKKAQSNVNPQ